MQKTKRSRFVLVAVTIFSMIAMYGFVPAAQAVSLDSAKDTLSDSDLGVVATHTIVFDMGTANFLTGGETARFTFNSNFTGVLDTNATCPSETTASSTGQMLDCVVDAGGFLESTTTQTMILTDVTNPGTLGEYDVTVSTHETDDTEIEASEMQVYIIDDVSVTATVPATLTFTIAATTTGAIISGATTDVDSSTTTVPFGSLEPGTKKNVAQQVSVVTNANDGYSVTIQQDHNLETAGSADIDPVGTSSKAVWPTLSPDISDENTWGRMGVTSDDSGVFTSGQYQGLDENQPALEVMSHDGPTLGTTLGAGLGHVLFAIEVSDIQEAGDYSNTITYVCTPTY